MKELIETRKNRNLTKYLTNPEPISIVMLGPIGMGLWGMILAPGIAQLAYQNWRWPSMVIRELR